MFVCLQNNSKSFGQILMIFFGGGGINNGTGNRSFDFGSDLDNFLKDFFIITLTSNISDFGLGGVVCSLSSLIFH